MGSLGQGVGPTRQELKTSWLGNCGIIQNPTKGACFNGRGTILITIRVLAETNGQIRIGHNSMCRKSSVLMQCGGGSFTPNELSRAV